MKTSLRLPVSAEILIPHAPPMRWVERLLRVDGEKGEAASHRLSENPLFSDTAVLPLFVMAELIAQAYAAMKGYQDLSAGLPVRKGFLVGIRRIRIFECVYGTRAFLIRIRPTGALGEFYMAEGEVTLDGRCVAEGSVKVWIPGKAQEAPFQ
ncbi:MAG: hypothetical protein JRI76_04960 [Deltaproteobacteria bacterium]|nr:hypothetical protein [Deltaproteobacteria bacterium]MBW2041367.1 hypothetical protein [Deltaproteobacteria bacterium]MBW2131521.1 hypothetical protein [Deltaproteobacteria bacterium]